MDKRNEVLIIGDPDKARSLFGPGRHDRNRFTYCARDNCTGASTDQLGRQFDWIVIKGEALVGDETEFIQSLRAMGFLPEQAHSGAAGGCGVEWLRDGSLQLRCCMQQPAPARAVTAVSGSSPQAAEFIFEYQAPVKRTG